jgi:hypothetical protein
MLPDELSETLKRTETLAIQSALALCLAYELMDRFNRGCVIASEPGLSDLRDRVRRVGEALGTVLERVHAEDVDDNPSFIQPRPADARRLN